MNAKAPTTTAARADAAAILASSLLPEDCTHVVRLYLPGGAIIDQIVNLDSQEWTELSRDSDGALEFLRQEIASKLSDPGCGATFHYTLDRVYGGQWFSIVKAAHVAAAQIVPAREFIGRIAASSMWPSMTAALTAQESKPETDKKQTNAHVKVW